MTDQTSDHHSAFVSLPGIHGREACVRPSAVAAVLPHPEGGHDASLVVFHSGREVSVAASVRATSVLLGEP